MTTKITLTDNRLRVVTVYHPEIVARLKECHGTWDKAARVWWVDRVNGDKLLALLPKAEYDYAALCACWDAQDARGRYFAEAMALLGVELVCDASGAVCGHSDHVSPLLQAEIAKRSDALRPWVGRLRVRRPHTPEPVSVPVAAEDEEARQLGLWLTGVKNAAAKAEQEQQYKRPKYMRKRKAAE